VNLGLLAANFDVETWREEASLVHPHYERFGSHTPQRLWDQLTALEERLS